MTLIVFAVGAAREISVVLHWGRGFRDPVQTAASVLVLCGQTLVPIVALYWVPKIIRNMFPEVR
ncbi:MAG: hypothetical protein AAFQ58_04445 [Pseudomonadota bacterium]